MRQVTTTFIALLMGLIFMTIIPAGAKALNITELDYDVLSSQDLEEVDSCYSRKQKRMINNKLTEVCLYEKDNISVGHYYDYDGYSRIKIGASFIAGAELYPVKMNGQWLECKYTRCFYLSDSDTLLTLENVNSQYSLTPVLYKNFTQNLQINSSVEGKFFDYEAPNREVMKATENGSGFTVSGLDINISNNGKWLIAELHGIGIVRFNLKEGSHLRIYPDILEHRTGWLSSSELAIDDSGENIAHVGMNAGFKLYQIGNNCGDTKLDESSLQNPCIRRDIDPDKIIWSMNYAKTPSFTKNGNLQLVAISSDPYLKYKLVQIGEGNSRESTLDFLSLGDSFTSGEGETDDKYYLPGTNNEKEKCHVSSRSYPFLVANKLNHQTSKVQSVACSGAITEDITGHPGYLGQRGRLKDLVGPTMLVSNLQNQARQNYLPGRIEQQYFIDYSKADTITIGIGGNDSGLMAKLNQCALLDTCKWAKDENYKTAVGQEIKNLSNKLIKVYKEALHASPKSKIYAVGYPQIISTAPSCQEIIGTIFNQTERIFIHQSLSYINQIVRQAAHIAGINYLDIENSFGNHLLCSTTETPAMNGLRFGDDKEILNIGKYIGNESFHPTPFGHKLIAEDIKDQILEPLPTKIEDFPTDYWKDNLNSTLNLKHLDILNLDAEKIKTISSMLIPNSTGNLEIKKLDENKVITNDSFRVGEWMVPDLNIDSWEEGVYSLLLTGQSRNDTPIEFYDSFVKNNIEEERSKGENSSEQVENDGATELTKTYSETTLASSLTQAFLPRSNYYKVAQLAPIFFKTVSKDSQIPEENKEKSILTNEVLTRNQDILGATPTVTLKPKFQPSNLKTYLQFIKYVGFAIVLTGIVYKILRR